MKALAKVVANLKKDLNVFVRETLNQQHVLVFSESLVVVLIFPLKSTRVHTRHGQQRRRSTGHKRH